MMKILAIPSGSSSSGGGGNHFFPIVSKRREKENILYKSGKKQKNKINDSGFIKWM